VKLFLYYRATPPMRRKPCEGRNIDDSEADLYAEFHGSPRNQINNSDLDIDLESSLEENIQMRHRKRNETQEKWQESDDRREESYSLKERFPDLKSTIDTNFSRMHKALSPKSSNSDSQSQTQNMTQRGSMFSREGSLSPGSTQSSGSKSSLSPDDALARQDRKSVSPGAGFNFAERFAGVYNDHERQMEERIDDERAADARSHRSKSWSEGETQ